MQEYPTIGIYRHFKGSYYFVQNVGVTDTTTGEKRCYYFNLLHPEYGFFTRPVSEWFSTDSDNGLISEREDNVTGQETRFKRILDLNYQLGSESTENLVKELLKRPDSPVHTLDVSDSGSIDSVEYVIGSKTTNDYVMPRVAFDSLEEAQDFIQKYKRYPNESLYKRLYVNLEDGR